MYKNMSKERFEKTKVYHDTILHQYTLLNRTDKEIAFDLGLTVNDVTRYRKLTGIDKLYNNDEWVKQQHLTGLSARKISEKINVSPGVIQKRFRELGLRESAVKRKLTINDNFFSTYTKESCYWAGFINADGHIAAETGYGRVKPNYYFNLLLSSKDERHLRRFNELLTRENIVTFKQTKIGDKIHDLVNMRVSRKKLCTDLMENFDIPTGKKSLSEVISQKIPKEFYPDFLRGHFDGDGSIIISNGTPHLNVIGGKELCESFKKIIDEEYGRDIGTIKEDIRDNGVTWYLYRVQRAKDIALIYLYLYGDLKKNSNLFLERKRDVFKQILHKI